MSGLLLHIEVTGHGLVPLSAHLAPDPVAALWDKFAEAGDALDRYLDDAARQRYHEAGCAFVAADANSLEGVALKLRHALSLSEAGGCEAIDAVLTAAIGDLHRLASSAVA